MNPHPVAVELALRLSHVDCVDAVIFGDGTLVVCMDTAIPGLQPDASWSIIEGTLVYRRTNEILAALAEQWKRGPIPFKVELLPGTFTVPVAWEHVLFQRPG